MSSMLAVLLGLATFAEAKPVAEQEPFASKPADLLGAFPKADPSSDASIETLLESATYRFDQQGRKTYISHRIVRVLTANGAERLRTQRVEWAPWHQGRPELKARVISPDGQEHWLNPETLSVAPVGQSGTNTFSDRRQLLAPLPALAPGAVVELRTVIRESQPFSSAGSLNREWLELFSKVSHRRVKVEVPKTLPLRWAVRHADLKPKVSEEGKIRTYIWNCQDLDQAEFPEPDRPPEILPLAHLVFTTAKSWSDVAEEYHKLAEPHYQTEQLAARVRQLCGNAQTAREKCKRILRGLHGQVDYTGLSFGSRAIVPHSATKTWQRQLGDCKDQSTLLVGLLRAVDVEAKIALLKTPGYLGFGHDLDPEMPGLDDFNHAIVYVPGEKPIWIDPTDPYLDLGVLPSTDQNRWALVISPDTQELIKTPRMSARENRIEHRYEIRASAEGKVEFHYEVETRGLFAGDYRAFMAQKSPAEQRRQWENELKRRFGSEKLVSLKSDPLDSLSDPYSIRLQADEASRSVLSSDLEFSFLVSLSDAFSRLPYWMRGRGGGQNGQRVKRVSPVLLREPYEARLNYLLVPPPGFEIEELPENRKIDVGEFQFQLKCERKDDQTVVVDAALTTGDGKFSANEAEEIRRALEELQNGTTGRERMGNLSVRFRHRGAKLLESGRYAEAVEVDRELLKKHPDSVICQTHYSSLLLKLGLGDAAREAARKAVAMDPQSDWAHHQLGHTLLFDSFGRENGWNADHRAAESALRKAVQLNPKNYVAQWELAVSLQFDEDGIRFTSPESLNESIAIMKNVRPELPANGDFDFQLAFALLKAGRRGEALEVARSNPAQPKMLGIELAILAMDDVSRALARSRRLTVQDVVRRQSLALAGDYLTISRKYPESAKLLGEALAGLPEGRVPAWERSKESAETLRSYRKVLAEKGTPKRLVQELYLAALRDQDEADLESLFWPEPGNESPPRPLVRRLRKQLQPRQERIKSAWGNFGWLEDSVALLEVEVETEKDGPIHRIRTSMPELPQLTWLAVPYKEGLRLFDPGHGYSEVGRVVLDLLEKENDERAKSLMKWIWDGPQSKTGLFDSYRGAPYAYIWAYSRDLEELPRLKLTAAALAAQSEDSKPAIPLLKKQMAEADAAEELQLRRALCHAYAHAEQWDQVVKVSRPLVEPPIRQTPTLSRHVLARSRLNQWDELEALSTAQLKKDSDNVWALRLKAQVAYQMKKYDEAQKTWRQVLKQEPQDDFVDRRFLALCSILTDRVDAETVRHAQDAWQNGQTFVESWQILAAAQAAHGELEAARETLRKSFLARFDPKATSNDWAVLGLFAEQCRLPDAAQAAYEKVKGPEVYSELSFYSYAQNRLKALGEAETDSTPKPPAGN